MDKEGVKNVLGSEAQKRLSFFAKWKGKKIFKKIFENLLTNKLN